MATKIASSGRLSWTLNAGTNPSSGATIKRSVSLASIVPGAGTNSLGVVATAISTLFEKATMLVSYVETSHIVG